MIFNDRIRELRQHLNMTQSEFGEKIGASTEFVCRLEKTDRGLALKNVINVCQTFNVSADWLLGLTDESGWPDNDWYKPYRKRIRKTKINN